MSILQAADGGWRVSVEGPGGVQTAPLAAGRFILRMWRRNGGALRGTLQRDGDEGVAPFQCNMTLAQLVGNWLQIGEGEQGA